VPNLLATQKKKVAERLLNLDSSSESSEKKKPGIIIGESFLIAISMRCLFQPRKKSAALQPSGS